MKKYTLTLLQFSLSCAPPQKVEEPAPIVIDLGKSNPPTMEEELEYFSSELGFKEVARSTEDSFQKIAKLQNRASLEGTMYLDNSNQRFTYHYQPFPFCEQYTDNRYDGKIVFEYHSSSKTGEKKMSNVVTLTDVTPYGSLDKVELHVDGDVPFPVDTTFRSSWKAQQLHERLFRTAYQEIAEHYQHNRSLENFELQRIAMDKNWETYKLNHELLQSFLDQEPLFWDKIRIFNPCEL